MLAQYDSKWLNNIKKRQTWLEIEDWKSESCTMNKISYGAQWSFELLRLENVSACSCVSVMMVSRWCSGCGGGGQLPHFNWMHCQMIGSESEDAHVWQQESRPVAAQLSTQNKFNSLAIVWQEEREKAWHFSSHKSECLICLFTLGLKGV